MRHIKFISFLFMAFLGGICGSVMLQSAQSYAANEHRAGTTNFYNDFGKRIGVIGSHAGGEGTLFLFDGNDNIEVQMGAYPSGSERGQSMIGMNDRRNRLRMLLRLHGTNDSPTVIMKDNGGQDRIVFGLDASTQAPYFRYIDETGQSKQLF